MPHFPEYLPDIEPNECGYCRSTVQKDSLICAGCGSRRMFIKRPSGSGQTFLILLLSLFITYLGLYITDASDWVYSLNPKLGLLHTFIKYLMWFIWLMLGPITSLTLLFEAWERYKYPFNGKAWKKPKF